MSDNNMTDTYDDGNIPNIDTSKVASQNKMDNSTQKNMQDNAQNANNVEPLPESSRPRKDGPGGN